MYRLLILFLCLLPLLMKSTSLSAAEFGTIKITSNPVGCDVFVNGKKHGITPIIISDLQVGDSQIYLMKNGYLDKYLKYPITANRISKIHFDLQPTKWKKQYQSIKIGASITSTNGKQKLSDILPRLIIFKISEMNFIFMQ